MATLKQDNILVDGEDRLRLIDYDGAFLPSSPGSTARCSALVVPASGSGRTFLLSKAIDDYSIAIIVLSLYALVHDPSLFFRYSMVKISCWMHGKRVGYIDTFEDVGHAVGA